MTALLAVMPLTTETFDATGRCSHLPVLHLSVL
jgi:hypothetical protein